MSDWISVKDRLPRSGEYVLVCDGLGEVNIAYRSSAYHGWVSGCSIIPDSIFKDWETGIKAWMPLPQPYKEEP